MSSSGEETTIRSFYGSTDFHLCLNPESGDVICFFYTLNVTEQKAQELLFPQK